MKRTLILSLTVVCAVACGGDSDKRARQQEFETVQEGSVAGVTSTLGGPGENLPPITGTNADTTTDFGINPALAGAATPPAPVTSAYGIAPPPPMTSATPGYDPASEPVRSTPAAASRPAAIQPRPLENERETTPPVTTEPAPAPPADTDTGAPSAPQQQEQEPEEEGSAPTQTDTSSTEPPPPSF